MAQNKRPTDEEREGQVLDLYFNKGLSYGKIDKEERMSLRDVTVIIKKAKGETTSKEKGDQPPPIPAENFKEIYRRFMDGQSPLHVARFMNLRVEYVNELYIGFLNANKLF